MKTKKEKIFLALIISTFIATFVVGWLWGLALANGENSNSYAIFAIVLLVSGLALNAHYQNLVTERKIQETVDSVMDAIIEFRKETIKETEQKILKKINKK